MSWAILSLLMKVTRLPAATVSDFGDTPLAVIVKVVPPGAGEGDGAGAGAGAGAGDGELGELPPPHVVTTTAPPTTSADNQASRCIFTSLQVCRMTGLHAVYFFD